MTPDIINGVFETLGGFFLMLGVFKLHKDKLVKGVSWLATSFFAVWGMWNLYFYTSLEQWYSFYGGVFLVTVNTYYVAQMIYYVRKEKKITGGWEYTEV